jgi:hypothetical protein
MAAMNYGRLLLLFGMPFGHGKGVWELGKLEGVRGFVVGLYLRCGEVTCPNPFLVFEGFGNLPRFPNPSLTGPTRLD